MNYNFNKNYQFTTITQIKGHTLHELKNKYLYVVITSDLTGNENMKQLNKRANSRMELRGRIVPFSPLNTRYEDFYRVLEPSYKIGHNYFKRKIEWHFIGSDKAFRNICQTKYETYDNAIIYL